MGWKVEAFLLLGRCGILDFGKMAGSLVLGIYHSRSCIGVAWIDDLMIRRDGIDSGDI